MFRLVYIQLTPDPKHVTRKQCRQQPTQNTTTNLGASHTVLILFLLKYLK